MKTYEAVLKFSTKESRDIFFEGLSKNEPANVELHHETTDAHAADPLVVGLLVSVATGAASAVGEEVVSMISGLIKKIFEKKKKELPPEPVKIQIEVTHKVYIVSLNPRADQNMIDDNKIIELE